MFIKFKNVRIELKREEIESWNEIISIYWAMKSNKVEKERKIAKIIIDNRKEVKKMLELKNNELEKIIEKESILDFDNYGMFRTHAPFKVK